MIFIDSGAFLARYASLGLRNLDGGKGANLDLLPVQFEQILSA